MNRGFSRLPRIVLLVCYWGALQLSLPTSQAARQPASEAEVQKFLKLYKYDKDTPLNVTFSTKADRGMYLFEAFRFTSVNDQTVPGYLLLPKSPSKPSPCLLVLHGYGGSKNDSLLAAPMLVSSGFAVLALDAQYHGERKQAGKDIFSIDFQSDRDAMIQTILDWRRGIDYLQTRPEIDMDRLALVGASMGGILGGVLTALDERIKAAGLLVAGGDWGSLIMKSQIPQAVKIRQLVPNLTEESVSQLMDPVDPLHFIGRISPRPLLMQNGKKDTIVIPECSQRLFEAAKDPKEIDWYESNHDIPVVQVLPRLVAWLKKNLQ